MDKAKKLQIGGDHYLDMGLQPWDAMEAWLTDNEYIGYHVGTSIAYLGRWRRKGGFEDIQKAHHHLSRLLEWKRHNSDDEEDTIWNGD